MSIEFTGIRENRPGTSFEVRCLTCYQIELPLEIEMNEINKLGLLSEAGRIFDKKEAIALVHGHERFYGQDHLIIIKGTQFWNSGDIGSFKNFSLDPKDWQIF